MPEDRHHVGLVLPFEESENSILGYHDKPQYLNGPFLNIDAIVEDAKAKIEKYDIRPANPHLKTANFSGGNQQKIVLAREMEQDPGVLIVGQPTRGVDVGAIEFIHKRLIAMRDAGKAVLLVSVELDEIRSLSDRILVMFAGRIVGERGPDATEGELGLLMAGVEQQGSRRMSTPFAKLPRLGRLRRDPVINLLVAFLVAGMVVLLVGENPFHAAAVLVEGAFGSGQNIAYTLYYATNFIFTGLAVAVAFHCRAVQHRRRGSGLYRRPWRRHRRPGARPRRALVR